MKHRNPTVVLAVAAMIAAPVACGQQAERKAGQKLEQKTEQKLEPKTDVRIERGRLIQFVNDPIQVRVPRLQIQRQGAIQLLNGLQVQGAAPGRAVAPRFIVFQGQQVQLAGAGVAVAGGDTSPLCHGAFQDALEAFDEARQEIETAPDGASARAALDRIETALVRAREALWGQKATAAKTLPPAQQAWQPIVQRRQVEPRFRLLFGDSEDAPEPCPFLEGTYRAAVSELDAARRRLGAAAGLEAAFESLDGATRSLMKAGRAMRRQLGGARRETGNRASRR